MYAGAVGGPSALAATKPISLGGILIEPFAACSMPPKRKPPGWDGICSAHGEVSVNIKTRWVVPLAQVAGISSMALAHNVVEAKCEGLWELMGCPELYIWNSHLDGAEFGFGDGGGNDNLALLPPLRRGVSKVLACHALTVAPSTTDDFAASQYNLSSYFGRVPKTYKRAYLNEACQVFESSAWDCLADTLTSRQAEGLPLKWRQKLKVLPNDVQGVAGNYEVDVLILCLGGESAWGDLLPADTQALVAGSPNGFPRILTSVLDFSPLEVNLLSQLCTWNIHEISSDIDAMFSG